ncbi:MAG: hypothetical protein ABFS86_02765 [Planctomycetota bacterium]
MARRTSILLFLILTACAEESEPVIFVELSRKDFYEVPLPDVPGSSLVDEAVELRIRIVLDDDGRYVVEGKRMNGEELTRKLLVHAERKRDMEHYMQWSMVRGFLAVHRDGTWGDLESLLKIVADPDIRIRHAELATFEEKDSWDRRAIPLLMDVRQAKVAHLEPVIELRIGVGADEPGRLAALERILANADHDHVERGIRVAIDPKMSVGAALRALVVVARRGAPELLCVPDDGSVTGVIASGIPVKPAPGTPAETPVTIPLTLDLR